MKNIKIWILFLDYSFKKLKVQVVWLVFKFWLNILIWEHSTRPLLEPLPLMRNIWCLNNSKILKLSLGINFILFCIDTFGSAVNLLARSTPCAESSSPTPPRRAKGPSGSGQEKFQVCTTGVYIKEPVAKAPVYWNDFTLRGTATRYSRCGHDLYSIFFLAPVRKIISVQEIYSDSLFEVHILPPPPFLIYVFKKFSAFLL